MLLGRFALCASLSILCSYSANATDCHLLDSVFGKPSGPIRLSSVDVPIHSVLYATEPAATIQSLFKTSSNETLEVQHLMQLKSRLPASEYARLTEKHKTFANQEFVAKKWTVKNGVIETDYYRPESAIVKIQVDPILNLSTRNRYRAFKTLDAKRQTAMYSRIREMSNRGFDLEKIVQNGQEMSLTFKRNPQLVDNPFFKVPPNITLVDNQIEKALSTLPKAKEYYSLDIEPDSVLNIEFSPRGKRLTSKTINEFKSDYGYSFSQVRGETNLRIVADAENSHLLSSGRQEVETAGEILIKRDQNNVITEVWLKPQSGHFKPDTSSLRKAVHAMWRQGVYPPKIKIFSDVKDKWENLVFESK